MKDNVGAVAGAIIHIATLESCLYMISFVRMLLRRTNNLDMGKRSGLNQKKNVRSIVIG